MPVAGSVVYCSSCSKKNSLTAFSAPSTPTTWWPWSAKLQEKQLLPSKLSLENLFSQRWIKNYQIQKLWVMEPIMSWRACDIFPVLRGHFLPNNCVFIHLFCTWSFNHLQKQDLYDSLIALSLPPWENELLTFAPLHYPVQDEWNELTQSVVSRDETINQLKMSRLTKVVFHCSLWLHWNERGRALHCIQRDDKNKTRKVQK